VLLWNGENLTGISKTAPENIMNDDITVLIKKFLTGLALQTVANSIQSVLQEDLVFGGGGDFMHDRVMARTPEGTV
jgi:hypothetical protein